MAVKHRADSIKAIQEAEQQRQAEAERLKKLEEKLDGTGSVDTDAIWEEIAAAVREGVNSLDKP